MPKLDISKGYRFSKEYVFPNSDVLLIGRTAPSDIVLPDDSRVVSRHHAAIIRLPGAAADRFFIRDLGSLRGTMLGGAPIYQRLLEDGDVIRIGEYQLAYSLRSEQRLQSCHLRVAAKKTDERLLEGSTRALKLSRVLGEGPVTSEKRELLEEIYRRVNRNATLSEWANELVKAILSVLQADKGLIGLFNVEGPRGYQELGTANLGDKEVIEILDAAFGQHLLEGRTVQEDATVLSPIYDRDKVTGFFCVYRSDREKRFSADDVSFLVRLGRLVSSWHPSREEMLDGGVPAAVNATEIIEWPLEMVGKSEIVNEMSKQISMAAATDMNVLISGETGSGKELIAKAIHQRSAQARGPFIAKNCPQTTETLAETEIFGYAPKSGISDSNPQGAPGWFELADGGTLFLDEIHRLTEPMQDKFLRVLQDKEVWRFGAPSPVRVNTRVVAATDQNLEEAVKEGRMRTPFYYRFGIRVHVPPLRYRKEDIPLLVFYFLDKYAKRLSSRARTVSHRALRQLLEYDWPGNVRQLEHLIHAAVAKDQEVLFSWDLGGQVDELPKTDREHALKVAERETATGSRLPKSMGETEKEKIKEALEVTHGNVTRAAQLLGYKSRQTMLNKMDRYEIARDYADPKIPGTGQ